MKAINKVPELRFQYMVEFGEAIDSQTVPVIFNQDLIKAAEIAELAEHALNRKKWKNALKYLEFGYKKYPNDVSLLQSFGKYCLATHQIFSAKQFIEKALRINTRLDLQKDLGWINLENKKYPTAISLLSDHLHRHPSDYESYNLLLRCYYETNRFEPSMELAKMLTESNPNHLCFANNFYISYVLHHKNKRNNPEDVVKPTDCHFINYNKSVFQEKQASYDMNAKPTLKSKLLFMEFQFNDFKIGNVSIINSADEEIAPDLAIIKIGRKGFKCNDIEIANGTSISRRHCLIINAKNDTWLYDLDSTGTYLNGELINQKAPIIELHKLKIGDTEFIVKPDKGRLFS